MLSNIEALKTKRWQAINQTMIPIRIQFKNSTKPKVNGLILTQKKPIHWVLHKKLHLTSNYHWYNTYDLQVPFYKESLKIVLSHNSMTSVWHKRNQFNEYCKKTSSKTCIIIDITLMICRCPFVRKVLQLPYSREY